MVQAHPAEEEEEEKCGEEAEDPKPADRAENSEVESILAAIEAKLDSETGSTPFDTDSNDDEDAFERKVKSMQGGFHEVLMAKPAEKAESEEEEETEPKTPPPVDNKNGEPEEEENPEFPEVKELTKDESPKKPPSSKKKRKSAKKAYAKAQKKKTHMLIEIANQNLEVGGSSGAKTA